MKIFERKQFSRILYMSLLLLLVAVILLFFSILSFLITSMPRPALEEAHQFARVLLEVLALFALVAVAGVVLSATVLLIREMQRSRKAEGSLGRFRLAAEASSDLVTVMFPSGRIEYVNDAVERATGFAKQDLLDRRFGPPLPWYGDVGLFRRMRETVAQGAEFAERLHGRRRSGEPIVIDERVVPFRDRQGKIVRMVSAARDLSRELSLEDRIEYLDRFDKLTGLPNRDNLLEQLDRTVAAAKAAGSFVSVLIIDIDRFRHVNEVFGSETGNEVLIQTARRVRGAVAPEDTVACTGPDEFTVVHVDAEKPVLAGAVAKKLQTELERLLVVNGQEMSLTGSVGVAVYPEDGDNGWTLLKNADMALARAKAHGRSAVQFYDTEITMRVREFFILEKRLFSALANNEYLLHYQPYCDLVTKKVSGAEALIRWKNPDLGVVSPSKFIPSLEETGKVIEVGQWIIETACRQSKEWEGKNRYFPISVNLSLAQFRHQHLVGMVNDTIRGHRIDPSRITLEVTESHFMHDMEFAIKTLKRLKDLGVTLSVDDFGTGYSSLSYVKRLPVDNLKIDISFVRDVTRDQNAASIVSAITTLAQSLKLKTIAEGVETDEQRNILHLLRCDMGQGFLFSPAVDAKEFDRVLLQGGGA